MLNRLKTPKDLQGLQALGDSMAQEIVRATSGSSKLLGHQVSLIEEFTHETKKIGKFGYCDYEVAFLTYYVAKALYTNCKNRSLKEIDGFLDDIDNALERKKESFEYIKSFIEVNNSHGDGESSNGKCLSENTENDPLVARLKGLKVAGNGSVPRGSVDKTLPTDSTNIGYGEVISPSQLHNLIYGNNGSTVLLIDYRARREFEYNHIKYPELVNIDPQWVESLDTKGPEANVLDEDLEKFLEMLLPAEQYKMFLKRYSYEYIVIYNFGYGSFGKDPERITGLYELMLNNQDSGISSHSPFIKLIDLIAYKNKYISSKLKRYPFILSGGVKNWHQVFGDKYLARSSPALVLSKPPASLAKGGRKDILPKESRIKSSNDGANSSVDSHSSSYLRNFGDYLSSAKSSKVGKNQSLPQNELYTSAKPIDYKTHYSRSTELGEDSAYKSNVSDVKLQYKEQQRPKRSSSSLKRLNSSSSSSGNTSTINGGNGISKDSIKLANTNPVKFLETYATGLTNLGNSCYMNCIIQCLGATPQLTKFFFPDISDSKLPTVSSIKSYRQHININNKLGSKGILTTQFVTLLVNMFTNTGRYFTPSEFKKVVGSLSPGRQFATGDQQDCIEFLNFILDGLHEDLNQMVVTDPSERKGIVELTPEQEKIRELLPLRLASTIEWERYLKLSFSIIVDYFQGQYCSHLRCLECGLTSTTYNAFLNLSLPIPERLGVSKELLLHDCLEEFVATELLDEDNKWKCPRCKKHTRLTKKISITRLPQVLIIHFKRFKIDPSGYFNKLETYVKYPVDQVLDLTSYWPSVGTYLSGSDSNQISSEREQQILSTLPTRNQQPPFRYKLYAVANHFGNLTTGHYTSYVHKSESGKKPKGWLYFDDAKITANCKTSQVLNRNAYCLFYQRI